MEYFQENINLKEVLVQIVAFITVFWILKLLAWNKILGLLEERRKKIQSGLDKIDTTQKSVDNLRAEYEQRLRDFEQETRKRLQDTILDGKRISREIQEEARRQARAILEKSKEDIELEIRKSRETLKNQIADLTLAATERLLQKKMDPEHDRVLVEEFIRQIGKT